MASKTLSLIMTRQKMLYVRDIANDPDQSDTLFGGQRIIEYREWKTDRLHESGHWRATVVLADGTRIDIAEKWR